MNTPNKPEPSKEMPNHGAPKAPDAGSQDNDDVSEVPPKESTN